MISADAIPWLLMPGSRSEQHSRIQLLKTCWQLKVALSAKGDLNRRIFDPSILGIYWTFNAVFRRDNTANQWRLSPTIANKRLL